MRADLSLRIARSVVFSVVCVLLAVGAHRFAGGAGPTPRVLLVGGLTVLAGATALAGRERSPVVVMGLLGAAQLFLHRLLGPVGPPSGYGSLTESAHVHHRGPGVQVTLAQAHGHGLGVQTMMLVAHLTAALITGWWLARGEAAVWSILRRIGASALRRLAPMFALLGTPVQAPVRPSPRRRRSARPRRWLTLRHAIVRRGPPVLLVF
ncbi:MFS transporter [Microbispora sp. RL4-1S]|uniref:MFS transporter n=1 Tax=Microbispora oryzae TaxID=2806554 RepID=A0A940WN91_9ACTN|nr:MFS transporter [Microbispora oryzae]MBP2703779.1 MFS transporter [Microbispora oryzae]